MNPILLAAFAFQLNFTAATSEGGAETDVGGEASAEVPIALPTDKYHCHRLPIATTKDTMAVMVGCTDKDDHPLFVFGALCRTDTNDADISTIVLNVNGPDKKARPVQITLTCNTQRKIEYNL